MINENQTVIFVSVTKGKSTSQNDIDVLVKLGNNISLLEFVRIKYEFEDLLERNYTAIVFYYPISSSP